MTDPKVVILAKGKETKHAIRYDYHTGSGVIRDVYIQKHELPNPPPDKIKVEINWE